jgi:glyoxylase-like metal-dependent hydrolase (beta-lactamase superfamily II)
MKDNFMLRYILTFLIIFTTTINATSKKFISKRLSQRVLLIQGHHDANNIVAIASEKGIIVIDTYYYPTAAVEIRQLIIDEFNRDDFIYTINTHSHHDHTCGNQIFSDTQIIGHQHCIDGMIKWDRLAKLIVEAQGQKFVNKYKKEMVLYNSDSQEAENLRMEIEHYDQRWKDFQELFQVTPPTITFEDKLHLNLGDINLKLLYYGRGHTNSDIIIQIPEEKLLLVGDIFHHNTLPNLTPYEINEIPKWISTLNIILKGNINYEYIISGSEDLIKHDELIFFRNYIVELYNKIKTAREDDKHIDLIKKEIKMEDYSELKDYDSFHEKNINSVWQSFTPNSEVEFRLKGYRDAKIVTIIGDFNNWRPISTKTTCLREGDEWVCKFRLYNGTYYYNYFVDNKIIPDPVNPNKIHTDKGQIQSIIKIE